MFSKSQDNMVTNFNDSQVGILTILTKLDIITGINSIDYIVIKDNIPNEQEASVQTNTSYTKR